MLVSEKKTIKEKLENSCNMSCGLEHHGPIDHLM